MAEPLWIRNREASELLTLQDAIDVLERTHREQSGGTATNMVKTQAQAGSANLHAVGGLLASSGVAGTKTWIHTPGGAHPILVLFDAADGSVLAIVEAFGLGQLRTAATSALATRALSRPASAALALVGTGKQAKAQALAVAAVRPIAVISVYGRDPERRRACVEEIQAETPSYVREEPDLDAALSHADVITLVTRASEPFVTGDQIRAGAHVNGVGAILPGRRELDVSAVARADVIAVDSLPQAQASAGELRAAAEGGAMEWNQVSELGSVLDGSRPGRGDDTDITFFKAMGVGIADVALGAEVLRRAGGRGVGCSLEEILTQGTRRPAASAKS